MTTIQFFVPGEPKAQPRPRAFAFQGKARVYDAGTAEGWKSCIAVAARKHLPAEPLTGPINLTIDYYLRRPKCHFGKGGVKPAHAGANHCQKPDLDNLDKAVMDALTQLRMWVDDSQVCHKKSAKYWGDHEFQHGANISLIQLHL